jgi:hypothetical protein
VNAAAQAMGVSCRTTWLASRPKSRLACLIVAPEHIAVRRLAPFGQVRGDETALSGVQFLRDAVA